MDASLLSHCFLTKKIRTHAEWTSVGNFIFMVLSEKYILHIFFKNLLRNHVCARDIHSQKSSSTRECVSAKSSAARRERERNRSRTVDECRQHRNEDRPWTGPWRSSYQFALRECFCELRRACGLTTVIRRRYVRTGRA